MKLAEKLKGLVKYSPIICFLVFEVFALISFSLSNSPLVFGILLTLLAIVVIVFTLSEYKREGIIKSLGLIIPILVYIIFTLVSNFTRYHVRVGNYSVGEIVFVGLGLASIVIVGYSLSLHKSFDVSILFTVIYSGLALLVLINLIINLVNFGPFYSIIYKNYYMYYGGQRSDVLVKDIAYALEGFKFIEVKMTHYTLYPILLLSSLVVLINLKFKENKVKFLVYCLFAFIAVLALVFVPSMVGLIYSLVLGIIIGFVMLFRKSKISRKPFAIILFVILGVALLTLIVMIFNNQGFAGNFHSFLENNAFLNRIFNANSYARSFNRNLTDVLCSERFFGFWQHGNSIVYPEIARSTDSILFDNFMTSGVIGTALIIAIFVIGFKSFKKYEVSDDKGLNEKGALITFSLIYVIYSFLCGDGNYAIFHNINKPTYMNSPFWIVLFMLVYVYSCSKNKEVITNEI